MKPSSYVGHRIPWEPSSKPSQAVGDSQSKDLDDFIVANKDRCLGQGRQVFWLARLADQQRVVASLVTQVGWLGKDTVLAGNGTVTLRDYHGF